MTFGSLKAALKVLINRKDLTDELAGDLIKRGISDIERELRIGPMEQVIESLPYDGIANSFLIPDGYLELIDIFTTDRQLVQKDKAGVYAEDSHDGPTVFCKIADRWIIAPAPAEDQIVYLHYYAETPTLTGDADENLWTRAGFNATLYASAALAADIFQMEDEVANRWGQKAAGYVESISQQDLREAWSGPMNIELPRGAGEY